MNFARMIEAGAVAGVVSIFTSWLITGVLFHRYQKLTPSTWRAEGPAQYAASSALNIVSCVGMALLYAHGVASSSGDGQWLLRGLHFGLLCWVALALPLTLTHALYVKLHRGVVVGLALDTLVMCVLAGVAVAWSLS